MSLSHSILGYKVPLMTSARKLKPAIGLWCTLVLLLVGLSVIWPIDISSASTMSFDAKNPSYSGLITLAFNEQAAELTIAIACSQETVS